MSFRNVEALSDPAQTSFAITPSDSVAIAGGPARAIYVGVSGDVCCALVNDNNPGHAAASVFKAMAVGWHPISVAYIYATNTTATNIIGVQ